MSFGAFKTVIVRHITMNHPGLWMERELHFRPNHFEEEFWLVSVFCDKEKIAIDIGANRGSYSYYMAKFSKEVIAFEPNADLWTGLRKLLGQNFHLERAALSGAGAKAIMRIDQNNTGVSTIEERNNLSCVEDCSNVITRVVETRTLDSYEICNVSMIKIDVEGHEEAVIEGARATIEMNRPVFIIESEDRHNPGAPHRLAKALFQHRYSGFYTKDRQLMDFNTLSCKDTDPKNLGGGGSPYINNFIFIPAEQSTKRKLAQTFLSTR